jgi:phosphoenolpyruvate carboxykinase (GTP)
VNYFLKDKSGNFLNEKTDKRVWYKWMERRAHREVEAIDTPTGRIPKYEDLKPLFKKILGKDYSKEDYTKQFTIRVPESLAKIERIVQIYKTKIKDTPDILFQVLSDQKQRLEKARAQYGDYITPDQLSAKK